MVANPSEDESDEETIRELIGDAWDGLTST